MPQSSQVLQKILTQSKHAIENGKTVKAYFDLDSTLFDVTPRVQRILEVFCEDNSMRLKYPQAIDILKTVQLETHPYYLKDLMLKIGLKNEEPHFYKEIFQFWKVRFFHDDYVVFDKAEKGAVEFVNRLYEMGVHIVYLTGRDIARMQKGTLESLKKAGFPIDAPNVELILKPHMDMEDAPFKMERFLLEDHSHQIWFFENEPVNIHLVLEKTPHVDVIYFDSVHSQKAEEPPAHIPRIKHFNFRS